MYKINVSLRRLLGTIDLFRDDNKEANERRYIGCSERDNGQTLKSVVSSSKYDNIALKRKRVFNKSLRDTEYAIASTSLFEHKPEKL